MLNQHQTIKDNIAKFNKLNPLVDYLIPFIEGRDATGAIEIADIASGPFSKIGRYLKGVLIKVYASDSQDFTDFYKKYKVVPMFPIEYQNMEHLTYPDNFFDIVHCANALDHTKDIKKAILEMVRVCKPGGWVYIDCHLDQMDTGHKHYWNAKEDGTFVNKFDRVPLKDWGFNIKYINNGGEKRYNRIVATWHKT